MKKRSSNNSANKLANGEKPSMLSELDGRLSSLSMQNSELDSNNNNNDNKTYSSTSSDDSESDESRSSSSTSQASRSANSRSSQSSSTHRNKNKNNKKKKESSSMNLLYTIVPNSVKYEMYLDSVIKNDYPEVLHYLITTKKCDLYHKDEHNKSLIFLAVMYEKPKILNYLIKRCPSIDINESCDSGNTPLHAAVNKGNLELVELLLQSSSQTNVVESVDSSGRKVYKLDIDKPNPKCMNATALHLAVWNDFNEIAIKLIQANANPYLKMNEMTTVFDLAKESSNEILYDLLVEYTSMKKAEQKS